MSESKLKTKQYISNCLFHIYTSSIHSRKINSLNDLVSESFLIADRYGLQAAHDYLVNIIGRIESNEFKYESLKTPKDNDNGN